MVDFGDVETARSNIRGNENGGRTGLESVKVGETLALLHLRMEGVDGDLEQSQCLEEASCGADTVDKDEGPSREALQKVVQVELFLFCSAEHMCFREPRCDNLEKAQNVNSYLKRGGKKNTNIPREPPHG